MFSSGSDNMLLWVAKMHPRTITVQYMFCRGGHKCVLYGCSLGYRVWRGLTRVFSWLQSMEGVLTRVFSWLQSMEGVLTRVFSWLQSMEAINKAREIIEYSKDTVLVEKVLAGLALSTCIFLYCFCACMVVCMCAIYVCVICAMRVCTLHTCLFAAGRVIGKNGKYIQQILEKSKVNNIRVVGEEDSDNTYPANQVGVPGVDVSKRGGLCEG